MRTKLKALLAAACLGAISAPALAQTDNCVTPTTLFAGTAQSGSTAGFTASGISASCDGSATLDGFYEFTPDITGEYDITVTPSGGFNAVLSLSDDCTFTNDLGCANNTGSGGVENIRLNGTQNVPIIIRVAGAGGSTGSFSIVATNRDICTLAPTIALNELRTDDTFDMSASPVTTTCGVFDDDDVFFKFTPASPGNYVVTVTPITPSFDPAVAVSTVCNFSTEVACAGDRGQGLPETAVTSLVSAGVPLFIRVAGEFFTQGEFTIQVTTAAALTNDECASATSLSLNVPVNGSNFLATSSGVSATCTTSVRDVWYTFTAPSAGTYAFTVDGYQGNAVAVYSSCGGSQLACSGAISGLTPNAAAAALANGQTVKVRVTGFADRSNTFTIIAEQVVNPTNDLCASAIVLPNGQTSYLASGLGATDDAAGSSCGLRRSVWFRINTGVDGVNLRLSSDNTLTYGYSLHTGNNACGSLTQVYCSELSDFAPAPTRYYNLALNPNTNYYLLVGMVNNLAPGQPYALTFDVTPNTGGCCNAGSCSISTRSDCVNAGGTYIADFSSCTPPAGSPQTFNAVGPAVPQAITDGGQIFADINVVPSFAVGAATISFTATHSSVGDLVIELFGPGTYTPLFIGDDARFFTLFAEFNGTYTLTDSASVTLVEAAGGFGAIAPGSYRASDFNGDAVRINDIVRSFNSAGTWTLSITDTANFDTGNLTAWSISLDGQNAGVCSTPTPCQIADYDNDGDVDVTDLFDFLDDWFAQQGGACTSNCSADIAAPFGGSPDVTDLFDYLDLWFFWQGTVSCP